VFQSEGFLIANLPTKTIANLQINEPFLGFRLGFDPQKISGHLSNSGCPTAGSWVWKATPDDTPRTPYGDFEIQVPNHLWEKFTNG